MKNKYRLLILICIIIALSVGVVLTLHKKNFDIKNYHLAGRVPKIKPDYIETVIPPNIAPLNFVIRESGQKYLLKIYSTNGQHVEVSSRTGKIQIPIRPWKALLNANRGKQLFYDIYVKDTGRWVRYETVTNTIATEPIDSHVVYRLMNPTYNLSHNTDIYQYDLENNRESLVLLGKSFDNGCVNCHSFINNRPERMTLGIRGKPYGNSTIITENGKAEKIGANFGHTTWHPTGRLIAYSIYRVKQFFHDTRPEVRDVVELDSRIVCYDVDKNIIKTPAVLSDKERLETHPVWSPDGRYLYFVSAPVLWSDRFTVPPENFEDVKYDLMRVSYDQQTDKWGELETVLSGEKISRSILIPKISPDNRYLLFCICDYSCFALFQPSSDLYLMDIQTGQYEELKIVNSDQAEAGHCWSSNSRWIVFSTKRPEGVLTRLYFSYIDGHGEAHKPFIMPHKDPEFYDSFVKIYNVPEFVTGPVKVSARELRKAIQSANKIDVELPITSPTPRSSQTLDYPAAL